MKRTVYLLAMAALIWFTLWVSTVNAATTIKLTDYWFCRGIGDSWTYEYTQPLGLDPFTVTITLITSGEYAGKIRWGDVVKPDGSKNYNISSYDNNNFILYNSNNQKIDPPLKIPITYELEKMADNPANPANGAWYFLKLDKLTVPAGTFYHILLKLDLDKNFGPNLGNTLFHLPANIPYGVTHAEWSALGVGILMDMDFNAAGQVGPIYQLKTTNATPAKRRGASSAILLLQE